jgi:hypothetical protein
MKSRKERRRKVLSRLKDVIARCKQEKGQEGKKI